MKAKYVEAIDEEEAIKVKVKVNILILWIVKWG